MFVTVALARIFAHVRFFIIFGFLTAFAASAQVTLETGKAVPEKINGGETREYKIALAANQFLRVTVEQRGADVAVALLAPDGKTLAEADSPTGAGGTETLLFVTDAAGDYKLRVASIEKNAKPGEFTVKISELAAATEKNRQQISAGKIVEAAVALQAQRTAAGFLAAIEKYKEALPLYQAAGDRDGELLARSRIGQIYPQIGQFKLAVEQNTAALALARETGNRSTEAMILDSLGTSYAESGEPARALESFEQSLKIRTEIGERFGISVALNGIAVVYQKTGNFPKAIEYNERLLAFARETGNAYNAAFATSNIGAAYASLGEHQKAVELFNQALPFFQQNKIGFFEINILLNLGNSYRVLGEQQRSIDFYNQALPLARATGNRLVEASLLNNIAGFYIDLGDDETALEYNLAALSIWREFKQTVRIAPALNNSGFIRFKAGDFEKATADFVEALALVREAKDPLTESYLLGNIGTAYRQQGKNADALKAFKESLEIRRTLKNLPLQVNSLGSIGSLQAAEGDLTAAFETLAQGVELIPNVNDPRLEADFLYALARAQTLARRFDEAEKSVDAALEIVESLRSKVANQTLRTSYLADVRDYYELRTEILMSRHKSEPTANFAARALESAENARARGLLELLNESRADIRQGVKPELLELERRTRQSIAEKASRQNQLLADEKTTPAQKTAIEAEIKQLTLAYDQIQSEIRRASPRYAALTQPAPVTVAEIQKQILDRDTVLLEYSLGDERSYLWVVGQNSLTAHELPARADIETAARRVYELLTARNQPAKDETAAQTRVRVELADRNFKAAADELSRLILPQLTRMQINGKRLLVVADGALQYVPFGALSVQQSKVQSPKSKVGKSATTSRFLIETNEIVNLPSAATLIALRRDAKPQNVNAASIAVVADPVFEATDARVAAANNKTPAPDNNAAKIARRAADESGVQNFARLRFSREEAETIAALASAENVTQILDFNASKQNVVSDKLSRANIVHFATHGLINSRNPELSGVVLSLVNEKGEPEDGFLRLYDIYNLPLNADLTVLSACQTALGKDIKGEGLIGLTRGFMYAGSPRVVASLWSVDDRATSELMRRFYQKLLLGQMRPAAALRAAQLEMSKNARFQPAYFWAAFTLQGEWR